MQVDDFTVFTGDFNTGRMIAGNKRVLLVIFVCCAVTSAAYSQSSKESMDTGFQLSWTNVGFGSNMFTLQPMFNIKDGKFLYTMEDAWLRKGAKKAQPDCIVEGDFKRSSIDSILALVSRLAVDSVYKANPHIMSGGAIYVRIVTPQRTINIELHNAFDATAEQIMRILNAYIPVQDRKLWVSKNMRQLTRVK